MNAEICIKEYEKELFEQQNPYEMWIRQNEGAILTEKIKANPADNQDDSCGDAVVIFCHRDGELEKDANRIFLEYFNNNKEHSFAYADEDIIKDGKRINPWFKPDYSPDTIESVNYIGSVFAIKKMLLLDIIKDIKAKDNTSYDFINKCNIEEDSVRVSRILFGQDNYEEYWNIVKLTFLRAEGGHIDRILYHGFKEEAFTKNVNHPRYEISESDRLSVIIPSKDNPDMLFECLKSVVKCADKKPEIIVVDNGSDEINRKRIEGFKSEIDFIYIYKAAEFNFSKMCNAGAMQASGNVLLFLNDDITVKTHGYDTMMMGQALRPLAGAVGAKLYYPDSFVIQHTGITNMGIGPAHKLCGVDDGGNISIYHGRNLADWNVYAVTGAALCITKEKYAEVLCFDERFPVAYNDVDLCFKLYDHGYYNIVRNDVIMYHHESVSRGNDESHEKKLRLKNEMKMLYKKHPDSYENDPFYSRHLVQQRYDGDYNIGYLYPHEDLSCLSDVEYVSAPKDSSSSVMRKVMRKGPVCQFNVDMAEKDSDRNIYIIEGWCGLTDMDQCLYDRTLLLMDANGKAYKCTVFNKLREDAAAVMPFQKFGQLLGFSCHIAAEKIPEGSYTPGVMFTNRLNGKTIVYYSNGEDNSFKIKL